MSSHDVRVLNDLIEILIDSADGYAEAAAEPEAVPYRATFQSRAGERRRAAARLQRQVQALGGDSERGGSGLPSAQRMFANLHRVLSIGDRALLAEAERGEASIRAQFERALCERGLGASTQAAIAEGYRVVTAQHEPIRWLRPTPHAAQLRT